MAKRSIARWIWVASTYPAVGFKTGISWACICSRCGSNGDKGLYCAICESRMTNGKIIP